MTDSNLKSRFEQLWPELVLTLAYWFTRLHNLTAFPVFDDESGHVRQAKMVWKLLPFAGADDGRVLNILLYAPFWPFGPGALWVSRAATILVGVAGFAALLVLGRATFGRNAGRWAGVFFLLLPYALFFERLALADTLGLPLVALLALSSLRAVRRRDNWAVLLGGLALAGVILAKLNNLIFLYVPLLALILLRPRRAWRAPIGGAVAIVALAIATLSPIVLFLVFRAHSTLGFANVAVRTGVMPLSERLAAHSATLGGFLGNYLPWTIAILVLAGFGLRLRRAATWYVLALAAAPILFFAFVSNSLESRYIVPVAAPLALLAGAGAASVVARSDPRVSGLATAVLAIAVAQTGPARFMLDVWSFPDRLALPAVDRPDYVEDWPSGFGVQEAGQLIVERSAREPLTVVVSEGWHIPGLTVSYGWEDNLHSLYDFSEPRLHIVWLQDGCDPFVAAGDPAGTVLYVTEHFRYAELNDCLEAEKTLIAAYPKPGVANIIEVYEIRRLPE